MRREKMITALWAAVFSFLLSFSAVAGLVSAFQMQVSVATLAWVCLFASLLGAACYSLPLGLLPPAALALGLGYYYNTGALAQSAESLLYRLSRQYHQGYGWGIIRWSGRVAEEMEQTLPLILCLLGVWIAIFICRGICRRKWMIFGFIPDVLCLAACFVVNDTPPDTVFLFLQMLCLIVLLLTGGVRRRDAAQGNRLTMLALPATALALLVLFACVPRQNYSNENAVKFSKFFTESKIVQTLLGNADDDHSQTGNVDLTQVGYNVQSQAKVMEVKADFTGTLYLRGRALDVYDGVSWTRGDVYNLSDLIWPSALESAGTVTIATKYAHSMLYVPYYATSKNMRESAFGVENGNKLTEYSFSTLAMPDADALEQYRADAGQLRNFMSQYIRLPEAVQTWATPVVMKATGEIKDVQETAQAIAGFVRNSATYDTNTPRMPRRGQDFARWFLEDSDTGYCVHFATATTVLLQAAGIPARYVTGYMVQAVKGEMVEVTGRQAHAWCEYWLPGFGWTVLESTPSDWLAAPPQGSESRPAQTPEQTTPEHSQNQVTAPQKVTVTKDISLAAVLLFVLAAAVWGQYALRRCVDKKRLKKGNANARALAHWQYALLLARHLKEPVSQVLQSLAEKAKFSQYTLTEPELAAFIGYENDAVARLKKKNIFIRLYNRLILSLY